MDILVKIERFQIKPNVINLKSTLGKEEFILETHQKIFSPMHTVAPRLESITHIKGQ